jgi:hypothetical protein
MRPVLRRLSLAVCLSVMGGCIASNVVATEDRLVGRPVTALAFAPAPGLQLDGFYESVEITGDAAIALRRIYYLFRADGTYTAAALGDADGRTAFQTLSGTWASTAGGLSLDGAEPVLLEQAGEHLRITAPTGAVVLRRAVLQ